MPKEIIDRFDIEMKEKYEIKSPTDFKKIRIVKDNKTFKDTQNIRIKEYYNLTKKEK